MAPSQLIGNHLDEQKRAVMVLDAEGPMSYERLKDELGIEERAKMQAVIRGVSDNGLVRSFVNGDGRGKFDVIDGAVETVS